MSDLFIANSDNAAGDTILDGAGDDDDAKNFAIGEEDIIGEGNDVTIDLRYKQGRHRRGARAQAR